MTTTNKAYPVTPVTPDREQFEVFWTEGDDPTPHYSRVSFHDQVVAESTARTGNLLEDARQAQYREGGIADYYRPHGPRTHWVARVTSSIEIIYPCICGSTDAYGGFDPTIQDDTQRAPNPDCKADHA